MLEFIETFLNALVKLAQDLLPDKNSNTMSWVIRMVVLCWMLFSILGFTYFVLTSTTLGEKYGVRVLTPVALPTLSHLELALSSRKTWSVLTSLRENNPEIRAAFLVMLYDKKTKNFINKQPTENNSDVLIWEWSIPDERYTTLELFEDSMNEAKPKYIQLLSKSKRCFSGLISNRTKEILERGIPEVKSSHFSACPIYTKRSGFLIGATLAFVKPKKETDMPLLEDRVFRATNLITSDYKDFTTKYEIYFE